MKKIAILLFFISALAYSQSDLKVRSIETTVLDAAEMNAIPLTKVTNGTRIYRADTKTIWIYDVNVWVDSGVGANGVGGGAADGNDFTTTGTLAGEDLTLTIPNQTNPVIDLSDFALDSDLGDYVLSSNLGVEISSLFPNLDTDNTDDFDGTWGSLTGIPADIADGDDDTQLTVDDALNGTSANPVENQIVTNALTGKQDVLTGNEAIFDDFIKQGLNTLTENLTLDRANAGSIFIRDNQLGIEHTSSLGVSVYPPDFDGGGNLIGGNNVDLIAEDPTDLSKSSSLNVNSNGINIRAQEAAIIEIPNNLGGVSKSFLFRDSYIADSDVPTKLDVDNAIAAASIGGATGNLWSDLVDSDILPDANGTRNIGAGGNRFDQGHFNDINVLNNFTLGGGEISNDLQLGGNMFFQSNGTIDINEGQLVDANSIIMSPTDIEPTGVEGVFYADDSEDRLKYNDGTSFRSLAYLDEIQAGSDDDITGVSFDGTTLTVTEGGTSFGADISSLDDSAGVSSNASDISGLIVDVANAEISSITLVGTTLTTNEGGNAQSVDLSPIAGGSGVQSNETGITNAASFDNIVTRPYTRNSPDAPAETVILETNVPIVETLTGSTIELDDVPAYVDDRNVDTANFIFTDVDAWEEATIDLNQANEPTFSGTGLTFIKLNGTTDWTGLVRIQAKFQAQANSTVIFYYYVRI